MKKKIFIVAIGLFLISATAIAVILFSSPYNGKESVELFIDNDDTTDSVTSKIEQCGISGTAFGLLNTIRPYRVRTGRYLINNTISGLNFFRKLRNGQQDPVNISVPSVRTLDRLASTLSRNILLDSATIMNGIHNAEFISKLGYDEQTIPALFIPDTYQVFWDITLDKLMERMQKEHNRFWNTERIAKAKALNMTPIEVATLASIVDEETANDEEKPMIAELYLNRLEINMPLQADPTVKVAVGDWSLRRILNVHLRTESPYNTYLHTGLTPGPIRVASKSGINAVLDHATHDYLYMCAKEDFSGTHNFAVTYTEHLQNARRYTDALNKRGIK